MSLQGLPAECYNALMKVSLKDGTDERVVILDTDDKGECATCERETPTLIVEGENWAKVEICPDCLIESLAPVCNKPVGG